MLLIEFLERKTISMKGTVCDINLDFDSSLEKKMKNYSRLLQTFLTIDGLLGY